MVAGGPGRRPSTGELLEAIARPGAAEVVVLPNDRDSVRGRRGRRAHRARTTDGIRVAVIPTDAQVQGLAALAVHEPGRPFDDDVVAMTAAARHARHGAVTVAARQAMTMAGPCEPGDVLGVVEGDFAVVGDDLVDGGPRRARPAARRRRRAGHAGRRRRARDGPGRALRRRTLAGAPPRRSTSWSTTAARSATRCWSGWSERGQELT